MNRIAMLTRALSLACLLVLVLPCSGRAREEPSFSLVSSVWEATDIVLATESGLADGKFSVLEAWKGSLVAKDALVIPSAPICGR